MGVRCMLGAPRGVFAADLLRLLNGTRCAVFARSDLCAYEGEGGMKLSAWWVVFRENW